MLRSQTILQEPETCSLAPGIARTIEGCSRDVPCYRIHCSVEILGGMDVRKHWENEVNPRSNTVLTIPLAPIREELIAARIASGVSLLDLKKNNIEMHYVETPVTSRRITMRILLRLCTLYYPDNALDNAFRLRNKALGIKEE